MSAAPDTVSTRDRILAAALSAFAQRGVEATSLDAVAAEIGIRKQTILYYFPSKDALVRGVLEHAADQVGALLGASAVGHGPGVDRLVAVIDAVYRLGAAEPDTIVLLREVSRLGPDHASDLQAAIEPLVSRAVAALAADGVDPERGRSVLVSAVAKVVGQATEVQVLRDLGVEPTVADLRRRRRELLGYLREALRAR
jgi:AcrR family transcriptional regulator